MTDQQTSRISSFEDVDLEFEYYHHNFRVIRADQICLGIDFAGIAFGMSILQNSLFDYNTALSQFLEVRRQQHPSLGLGFFPVLGSASGSDTTESLSPSPPAVSNTGKSFTIDAILGLRCKSNDGSTVLDYSNASSSKKNNGKRML